MTTSNNCTIRVSVHEQNGAALVYAAVSLYRWKGKGSFSPPSTFQDFMQHRLSDYEFIASGITNAKGHVPPFSKLQPGSYVAMYWHYPETVPEHVTVDQNGQVTLPFRLELTPVPAIEFSYLSQAGNITQTPHVGDSAQARLKLKSNQLSQHVQAGATRPWHPVAGSQFEFIASIDRAGRQTCQAQLLFERHPPAVNAVGGGAANVADPDPGAAAGALTLLKLSSSFEVPEPIAQPISGDIGVSLRRTKAEPADPTWLLIRNTTEALSFTNYKLFMDGLFCGDWNDVGGFEAGRFPKKAALYEDLKRHRALPFIDSDAYRVLKAATEAFVMVNCGVLTEPHAFNRAADNAYLEKRDIPSSGKLAEYLEKVDGVPMLPYLAIIRRKLPDIPISLPGGHEHDADLCYSILQDKLTNPCMLELIWSYWHEEGMLVQTMNAIAQRFQNVRGPGVGHDPLANFEVDILRPAQHLLWVYIQEEQHRLSVVRRNYEYDHQYGVRLEGKAVQHFRSADTRSKFLEAFHHLLRSLTVFYKQDDDTTVKADAFPILNGLKEVHLILSQGAHNQFGALTSAARIEMLMQQWLLARPEFREFLPTRIMVAYPEPWMDRVDAMKKIQGWTDTSVMHFRDLAKFGEQILLSIRFGNWSAIYEPTDAFAWARFHRPYAQGYMHAYGAATGHDLAAPLTDTRGEGIMPSVLLSQRLAQQSRSGV